MPKAVIVNYRKCTDCRICKLACSIRNEGVVSPQLLRIAKGQRLTKAQINQMLDEYYKLREWNIDTGTPSKEETRELELDFVNM